MPTPVVPDWVGAATQAVVRPPGKAYQIQLPSGQQLEAMQEQFFQSIVQQLMQVIDGYILPGQPPTSQLTDWSQAVNTATQNWATLFEDLGLPVSTATELADWLTGVNTSATTGNTGWQWIVDQFNQLAYGNSTTNNPMASITAAIQALLSDIPATSITSASKSLQLVSDFPTAASIVAGAGWSYDSVNGLYAAGCAQCTADGVGHTLYGNWIPVNEGDVMSPQAYAAWEGLASTGNPIALNLRTDTGIVDLVESISSPGASSSTYPGAIAGAAGTSHWVELSGTYTVPAGVAFVRSELYVASGATAGTVHFDNAPDYRSSSWLTAQLDGINADIGDIYQAFVTGNQAELTAAWHNLMGLLGSNPTAMKTGTGPTSNAFWAAIVNNFINPLNALEVQANNIIGEIDQSVVNGLTALWEFWTGTTTPSTGTKLLPGSVANVLGGANLGANLTGVNSTVGSHGNWFSQMLSSLGLGGGANTGTNIGGAISTAQSTASTASTTATANTGSINNTWSWLFGTTTPSSANTVLPTKVGQALGGLSLQNDLANLATALGMGSTVTTTSKVNATSITQALNQGSLGADIAALGALFFPSAPTTVGTAVAASALPNIAAGSGPGQSADLLSHLTNVAAATGSGGANPVAAAANALTTQQNTIVALSSQIQSFQTQTTGKTQSGQYFAVSFSSYPDGPFSAAPFNTTKTGSGTGGLVISGGNAAWSAVNNGDVQEIGIYNNGGTGQAYTDTVYQKLQATLAGYPNGAGSRNYAVLRANAATNPTDYVYGLVYLAANWTLSWELGCYIGGVHYIWASGTGAPLNLNFTFVAGVGGDPNRYQGYSGTQLVFNHVNNATNDGAAAVFPVDNSHRYWGFRSDTYSNGQITPAPASWVGCSDNAPPSVPGSSFRQYFTGGSYAAVTRTNGIGVFIGGMFDTNAVQTSDISPPLTTGSYTNGVQVSIAGTYRFNMRLEFTASASSGIISINPAVIVHPAAGGTDLQLVCAGSGWWGNIAGANVGTTSIAGSVNVPLQVGDIIVPAYWIELGSLGALSALNWVGDATGKTSWWSLALMNCSYN